VKSNSGSIWRKWDLHVHTPSSIYQKFGNNDESTWETYIKDLEGLPEEFTVIGVNDYLFLDGFERLKKVQKEGRLANLQLLPVVEFRIDKFAGVDFGALKRINLHVIFAETVDMETIQSQFLSTLQQSYTLESGEKWTRAITRQSVEELGKKIKEGVPESQKDKYGSDLKTGFDNLNIDDEAIIKSLDKSCFKDKYLIAIGKTEWGDLKWTDSSIATKKSIINSAHIIFTAAESIESYEKAKEQLKAQNVNDLLLDCSDAHYLSSSRDKDRIANCHTWIKAQPTFEGLRQILFEPSHRLKVQVGEPDFKEEKLVIEEVKFITKDGSFTPEPIKLNKNLNVIIGGKSSGKSILLFNIARTLLTDRSDSSVLKYRDTEDNQVKYLYNFPTDSTDFDFHVKLKSGSWQSIHRKDNDPSILPDIKYIPQNYLSNLVDRSRTQGNTLKKLIRSLILEDQNCNLAYSSFLDKVKSNDIERNRLVDDYFQLLDKISNQQTELMNKGDSKSILASISSNQQQIKTLNEQSGLSPEKIKEYETYNTELNELNISHQRILNDFSKLLKLQQELQQGLEGLDEKATQILGSLENDKIRTDLTTKLNFVKDAANSAKSLGDIFLMNEQHHLINHSIIRSELANKETRKASLDKQLEPLRLSQQSKLQIEALEKSILDDQQKLSSIQQILADINSTKTALLEKEKSIYKLIENSFKEYEALVVALSPRVRSIEGEDDKLEISGIPKYNFPRLKAAIEDITDLRSFDVSSLPLFSTRRTALSNFTFKELLEQLQDLFVKIVNGNHPMKRLSKIEACKKILDDFFFDHWEVISEGDTIHKMSTGKASFVLLKLIIKLSASKAPILIDQPEDNLDNRSVSKDLVTYLRDKKHDRQIIIVTHNPNIVVNADAENIIVANQKGQNDSDSSCPYKFDYVNGALEDSFTKIETETDLLKSMGIREHIAEIVEGGKEAFKKREKKYCF